MRPVLAVLLTTACATAAEPLKLVASVGTAKVFGDGQLLVSPDGKTVVLGDRWYDFESGKRIDPPFPLPKDASWHSLLAYGTVVVSHEEKLHVYPPKQTKPTVELETGGRVVTLSTSGKIALRLQVGENKPWALQVATPGKGEWKEVVNRVSYEPSSGDGWRLSPDGSRIIVRERGKNRLVVYSVATGKSQTLDLSEEKFRNLGYIGASADGTKVCLHNETTWKVFDTVKMELIRDIPAPEGFGDVRRGTITPDGEYLLGFGSEHQWIAVSLGDQKQAARVHRFTSRDYEHVFSHLVTRPSDGRQLIFTQGSGGVARLYDATTGKRLETHSDVTRGLYGQLVVDDRRALSWDRDNNYTVWDTTTGKELGRASVSVDRDPLGYWSNHWQVNLADDTLAVSSPHGGCVHVHLRDGKAVGKDEPSGKREEQIRFVSGGHTLTALTEDKKTEHPRTTIRNASTGKLVAVLKVRDDDFRFPSILFHPNGRTAVTADNGVVSLHELATGAARWTKEVPRAWSWGLHLSRTGDRVTVVPHFEPEVTQLDSRTGRITQSFLRENQKVRGKFGPPDHYALSADGRWLLGVPDAEHPERMHLYDLDEDRPRQRRTELTLPEHGRLAGIDFTPDGKRLVMTYQTGVCRVWDISPYTSRPPRATAMEREAAKRWDVLAGADAEAANDVMTALIRSPKLGLEVIAANLPGPPPDAKLVARWIADLGDKDFRIRDEATKALTGIAHQIDAELAAALVAKPSPEATARLTKLLALARTDEPVPEVVRTLRALEVLEAIGTPEAKAFVEKLAGGPPHTRLTRLAKESLTRFRK